MLQRIQTVYLALAFVMLALSLIFPLVSFDDGTVKLIGYGFMKEGVNVYIPYGVFCVGGLSAFLALIEIFLYRNRKLQMRVVLINTFFILFYYVTIGVYANFVGIAKLGLTFDSVKIALMLPLIALIFNILAYLKIKADEKLIRSLDRIR